MLDVFPHLAEELVDTINSNNVEDEVKAWMILLSKIIFKNSYSAERGLGDMINHFQSLESYIDPIVKEKLAENDLVINQFHYLRYSPIAHLHLLAPKAITGFSFGLTFLNLNQKLPH